MKKFLGFVACIAISSAIIFAGCKEAINNVGSIISNIPADNPASDVSENTASDTSSTVSEKPTSSAPKNQNTSAPEAGQGKYEWFCYERLNETQKDYYIKAYNALNDLVTDQVFFSKYGADGNFEANIRLAVFAVMNDHPEIFWADGTFTAFEHSQNHDKYLLFRYTETDKKIWERKKLELRERISALASQTDEMTPFEKEVFFHDYLCRTVIYSVDTELCDTSYGALIEDRASCAGYSKALQLLMNYCKLNCISVGGKAEDGAHMWNMVELSGEWYNLDVTWDDTANGTVYKYFNLTDKKMYENHTPDTVVTADTPADTVIPLGLALNISLPKANGTYYTAARIK